MEIYTYCHTLSLHDALPMSEDRHGGDDDAAGLEDAKPAGEQHRVVGTAQEDAIARDEPFLLDEQAGDAVGEVAHLAVGPASGIVEDGKRVRVRSEEHTSELQSLMRNS